MKFQDLLNNISAKQTHGVCKRKFSTGFLSIDQSTALINEATFSYFENYAEKNGFVQKFQDLKSGARLNNTSDDYSQVFLLIQSFIELKKKGVKFIDLEGMNSPKRSFFKNGFGGVLKPYYTVKS